MFKKCSSGIGSESGLTLPKHGLYKHELFIKALESTILGVFKSLTWISCLDS